MSVPLSTGTVIQELQNHLETAATLVGFVQEITVADFMQGSDKNLFETRECNAEPIVRALFCRELAGLSWNGLYKYLSTEHRAVRLGFDPAKFGKYNTAPTRQTLTTVWDVGLSDEAKRTVLSMSERLVTAADKNDDALDLRLPRHVNETDSDLRERHIGAFSDRGFTNTFGMLERPSLVRSTRTGWKCNVSGQSVR